MLREPYNLNPYNSTIDTSFIQPFSFVFSGDKLGSYQIQIAENNKGGNVLYTSPLVTVDDIYDGDVVEAPLPVVAQTNVDNSDGRLSYVYNIMISGGIFYPPEGTTSMRFYYYHGDLSVEEVLSGEHQTELFIFSTNTLDRITGNILASTGYTDDLGVVFECLNAQNISIYANSGSLKFKFYQIQIDKSHIELTDENISDYYMQIDSQVFDNLSLSTVVPSETDYVINLNTITTCPYYTFPSIVKYYLYEHETISSLAPYVGQDLIWRVLMWEDKKGSSVPQTHNFVRNGQIIARTSNTTTTTVPLDALTEVGVLMPLIESYIPTVNVAPVTRHCYIDETARCIAVAGTSPTWYLYVPITYAFDDYTRSSTDFSFAIIDNIYFTVGTIVEAPHPYDALTDPVTGELVNEYYKITLTQNYTTTADGARSLIDKQYYGYELIMANNATRTSFDEIVTYTAYSPQTLGAKENFTIESYATHERQAFSLDGTTSDGTLYIYAEYSTGNVRGYVNNLLTGSGHRFIVGSVYQLYSNFAFSNWTFFQSRKDPVTTLQYYNKQTAQYENFPVVDYKEREIRLKATYNQTNLIPIRYHQWVMRNKHDEIVADSGQIYDSDLTYTLSPLTEVENYNVVLTIVSQNNVVTTLSATLSTYFPSYFTLGTTPKVDKDKHYSSFVWDAALSASPSEDSQLPEPQEYGNNIGITNIYRDFKLDYGDLIYDKISGYEFGDSIALNDFSCRIGFTINDLLLEYNQLDLIRFDFTNGVMRLKKEGYYVSFLNGDVQSFTNQTLLEPTLGIGQYSTDISHRGEWLQWLDDDNLTWDDVDDPTSVTPSPRYWVETSSDTNVYYYQLVIKGNSSQTGSPVYLTRIPYMRGTLTEDDIDIGEDSTRITIPYNNLLINQDVSKVFMRFDQDVTSIKTITNITDNTDDGETMTITLSDYDPAPGEYVIFTSLPETPIKSGTFSTDQTYLNKFEFNPDINLYYMQLQSKYIESGFTALENLNKPSWNENLEGKFILLDFNDTLQSHQGGAAGQDSLPIYAYEVYRVKYASEEDAKNIAYETIDDKRYYTRLGQNEIYSKYIGTVDLLKEELISAAQIKFYDWTIENNGWYRYKIIPLGTTFERILYSEPFQTNWYGWSFWSFEPINGHYDIIERWNYYLNLETKGYTHVTNKVFHQGFNRYPKVSIGTTDYITSDMTGLIGDFRQTCDRENSIYGNDYEDDNIEKIYKWENFINDGHMILVKDYKGRAYIAQLDGGATNFQDVEKEILSTTSFNITQINKVEAYQIFKAIDIKDDKIEEV